MFLNCRVCQLRFSETHIQKGYIKVELLAGSDICHKRCNIVGASHRPITFSY